MGMGYCGDCQYHDNDKVSIDDCKNCKVLKSAKRWAYKDANIDWETGEPELDQKTEKKGN